MEWNNLLETTDYIGNELDWMKVTQLKGIAENGQYFLTFWGHYSAGKSRLINNILGMNILPVQVRETTPVMTYIRYGESEYGHIFMEDGSCRKVKVEEIRRIYQNSDQLETISVGDISHIELFLTNPLLESGLVIVDTPGVNTLIQKHQDFAINAIESSRRVVYVLGGPVSKSDETFIRQISGCGIEMTFVRTKCDLLNTSEEDPLEALMKEKEDLSKIYGEEARMHQVSNIPEKADWYRNLDGLRLDLTKISKNIHDEFEKSCQKQRSIYVKKYQELLALRLEDLKLLHDDNQIEVQKKLDECVNRIQKFEETINRQSASFETRINALKNEVRHALPDTLDRSIESYSARVSGIRPSANSSNLIETAFQEEVQKGIAQLQNVFQVHFNQFVTADQVPVYEVMQTAGIDTPEIPTYSEVEQMNAMVLRQYSAKMQEVKETLMELHAKKQDALAIADSYKDELENSEYEAALQELDLQMAQIPKEISMVISDDQPIQPSDVLKKVGQGVDLMLLLLPGSVIASGVKKVANSGKVAQVLKNSGKFGKVIVNAVNATESINKIDKGRDFLYGAKNIFVKSQKASPKDKRAAETLVNFVADKAELGFNIYKNQKNDSELHMNDQREGSVLDMIEVAYWTEKIGKNFNKPLKMVVDVEEERQKEEIRKSIYAQKSAVQKELNAKRRDFNLILSSHDELEREEKDKKRMLNEIEEELINQENDLRLKAEKLALEDYKNQYIKYFERNLTDIRERMESSYFKSLSENMTLQSAILNKRVTDELEKEKQRYDSLLHGNSDKETMEIEIDKVNQLIEKLQ